MKWDAKRVRGLLLVALREGTVGAVGKDDRTVKLDGRFDLERVAQDIADLTETDEG